MRQHHINAMTIPTRSLIGCYGWFLLMLSASIYGGYLSMERAYFFSILNPDEKIALNVTRVANLANRQILPDFRAFGYLLHSRKFIDIEIYRKDYERLNPGDQMFVLKIPEQESGYVDASRYQNNKPLFKLFGVPFAWHIFVILILFIFTAFTLWDLRKKTGFERIEQIRFLATMFYVKVTGALFILVGYALRPI